MLILRPLFSNYGSGFSFDPDGLYSYETISVGTDVNLGWRPILMAAKSQIKIGSKVMFGPEVIVIGGGHNTSEIGRFMYDVKVKRPGDDLGVVIEDDVWIGARAVILRGVTIGRGAIIGAGSVVTQSIPPYAVATGIPARVIKFRWNLETIIRHEEMLYTAEQRFGRDQLENHRIITGPRENDE